jgi:hypothetical protein
MPPVAERTNPTKAKEVSREISCPADYSNAPHAGTPLSVPQRLANVHARVSWRMFWRLPTNP